MKETRKTKEKSLKLTTLAFTLIELLAVIVILAVISIIAVPIVINITEGTKKSAFKESISIVSKAGQLYYTEVLLKNNEGIEEKIFEFPDSVEGLKIDKNKTLKGIMKVRKDGNTTFALSDGVYCAKKGYNDKNINYNKDIENCIIPVEIVELEVEENIVLNVEDIVTIAPVIFPSAATNKKLKWTSLDINIATVENGVITGVSPGSTTITVETMDGSNISKTINVTVKELIYQAVTLDNKTLAGNIPQGKFDKGDEYIVNVDGTNKYHFYVLNVEGDKVSLIMSNNICIDGALATESNKCTSQWYFSLKNNSNGPVTAMNYLHQATKKWKNIDNIRMNYTDEGNTGAYGYGTIKTNGNTTSITTKDGTTQTEIFENLKARMPKISEVSNAGCIESNSVSDFGSCPAWMVNGLSSQTSYYPEGTKEDIKGITGYWSLSSHTSTSSHARTVKYDGLISNLPVYNGDIYGIRPVIEVSKSDLQ